MNDDQMIGVWIPHEYKTRYDAIHKSNRRGFSKTLRELVKAAIETVEAKTA